MTSTAQLHFGKQLANSLEIKSIESAYYNYDEQGKATSITITFTLDELPIESKLRRVCT